MTDFIGKMVRKELEEDFFNSADTKQTYLHFYKYMSLWKNKSQYITKRYILNAAKQIMLFAIIRKYKNQAYINCIINVNYISTYKLNS